MFVSVQSLTTVIDERLQYLKEARENKNNFEKSVFEEYENKMKKTLENNLIKLKQISCNKKLIERYEKKINEAIEQIEK